MATRDSASPGDRIAELLARYHLGHYVNRPAVQSRLADLFAACPTPPGTLDRLLVACEHLGVTGHEAAELVARAHDLGPTPARDYLAATIREAAA